jgi:glycosyltransferase involved in cell wall biosynthesis
MSDRGEGVPHRILILTKGLGIGGAEKLISSGSAYWSFDRFEYHVAYILPWKDALVPELERRGVRVTCIGGKKGVDPLVPLRWRALIKRFRPDLVHAHLPSAGILARLFTPAPVIYTEHNIASSYKPLTRVVNRLTYGKNTMTVAVSDAVLESIADFPGGPHRMIENGVAIEPSVDRSVPVREELGVGDSTSLVVHVGNIRPHKGHATLLAAAELLTDGHDDVVVVSVGGEKFPGDLERLRSQARERGIDGKIRFLGSRPDALDFVAEAAVFVNPADVEGLPVAILEAMALGKPVVATAVGGVPSVVIDGETGRLVPPKDPVSLASAVAELLAKPELRHSLGTKGRDLIESRYGLARMVERYEDLYEQVLGVARR